MLKRVNLSKLLLLIFSLLLISSTLLIKKVNTNIKAYFPVPCRVCDSYKKTCVDSGYASCDNFENECSTDSDCGGGGGGGTIDVPCTYCEDLKGFGTGYCVSNPPPCTKYLCNLGDRCDVSVNNEWGDCPLNYGFPWCEQTNPKWANEPFPVCGDPNNNHLWKKGCVPSTACSILCKYAGKQFCNVKDCIVSDEFMSKYTSCKGQAIQWVEEVFKQDEYKDLFDWERVKYSYNNQGVAVVTKDSIMDVLDSGGVVLVYGNFKSKNEGAHLVEHASLVVGYNEETGKLIFNDPYYNCDNPSSTDRVCDDELEGKVTFEFFDAIQVSKKK